MRNVLFVISGPSGVGKGTIAKKLCSMDSSLALSVSCTTRQPRPGEQNGKDYFFLNEQQFKNEIDNGGLLEYSLHFENYYGTPKQYVVDKLKETDVLLEIDVDGALIVKKNYPDAILFMITPPSIHELKQRLIRRHTESEDKIDLRLSRVDFELGLKARYDYIVLNDNVNRACKEILAILKKEKNK